MHVNNLYGIVTRPDQKQTLDNKKSLTSPQKKGMMMMPSKTMWPSRREQIHSLNFIRSASVFCFFVLWWIQTIVLCFQGTLFFDATNNKDDDGAASYELRMLSTKVQELTNSVQTLQTAANASKSELEQLQNQLDAFQYKGVLAFLHIGKTGGTAFDVVGASIAEDMGLEYFKMGRKHYDWSAIDAMKQKRHKKTKVSVVTTLRNPVDRAVSHFYYWKAGDWSQGMKIRNQSLSDYLWEGNKGNMLDTRDIWQDGQAGVSWFTGTHIGSWVIGKVSEAVVKEREQRASNVTAMLSLAAARLRETKWFGMLEDIPRSMELLQHAFHLRKVPSLPTKNKNNMRPHLNISKADYEALTSLMPQDIWFYNYAKLLFEARWQEYKTGIYVAPPEPPFPQTLPCVSTRLELNCTSGPLATFFAPSKAD